MARTSPTSPFLSQPSHTAAPSAQPAARAVLIDINELSRLLNIPKGTLYNWCYRRRIPFIKAGRSLRFEVYDVIQSLPHSPTMGSAGQRWKGQ